MTSKTGVVLLVAACLAAVAVEGFAQGGGQSGGQSGGQGGAQGPRDPQLDRGRDPALDRDRRQDRERLDRTGRDRAQDQDRDQDRLRWPQSAPLRDEDIFGHEMMSAGERNAYREKIRNAESIEERERLRAQHQAEIVARAKTRGVDPAPASEGPIYGAALLTAQERDQYRERLRTMPSDAERERFMAEHRAEVRERARAQGVAIPE